MSFDVYLSAPDVGALEEEYLVRALRSGWAAPAGPDLDSFEQEMAERVGVGYAVGLASGTAGLHLVLRSWGVGPGDVVVVPTFTFVATANAVIYTGATPYFVDCEMSTGNLDPHLLDQALDDLASQGSRVPVVVAVDMLGKAADYTRLQEVCDRHGARLLSDAAESLGASHADVPAGAHGDVAVVSFNGNKVMTTSGGGMLLTDDAALAAHVRKMATQAREPAVHYEHAELGFNYRLSNLLAALGRAQLSRLDAMIARRRGWRDQYRQLFAGAEGVEILGGTDDVQDNCWLTALTVDPEQSPWSASDLASVLTDAGIESRPVWKPMHLQPLFADHASTLSGAADRLFATGITLPSGSGMTDDQFDGVVEVIQRKVLST
ncbi:DegT/DnrJ/EryC1/StrS family aminotransferase [Nocardioides marmoribigeumensis]|uniref:dTDP-4-amino-4,6-dideoxygalactose transaminase n=1 Tax=Nocardioides marmoribigeumensis TaxID=433649 RepID=A0ABU2BTP2_9ACTN|nr:aminotransferase class I/II-fold pyridoxal phosphate-dependent enzyme [Nocardioides marmoribigeumensis]MDR7361995.1 dTDP-4-amino-4,6-dideoxygalactose transaminase [Nocardioides marmoribigeumensis]